MKSRETKTAAKERKWRKMKQNRKNSGHHKGKKTKGLSRPQHDWNIRNCRFDRENKQKQKRGTQGKTKSPNAKKKPLFLFSCPHKSENAKKEKKILRSVIGKRKTVHENCYGKWTIIVVVTQEPFPTTS